MNAKWMEHNMNEEVFEIVKEKRMLIKIIRERQKNLVGYVLTLFCERYGREGWKERG